MPYSSKVVFLLVVISTTQFRPSSSAQLSPPTVAQTSTTSGSPHVAPEPVQSGTGIHKELDPQPQPLTSPLVSNGQNQKSSVPIGRRSCNMFARKSCICRMSFKPVCGKDGITYANLCQFQCAQRCEPGLKFGRCGTCWQNGSPTSRSCLLTA